VLHRGAGKKNGLMSRNIGVVIESRIAPSATSES
jgi:hypothetical protein